MLRLFVLAVTAFCLSLNAHAWKSYSDAGSLLADISRGKCVEDAPEGFNCLSKDIRYVRTGTGTMPVRLWSVSQLDGEQMGVILDRYNLPREDFTRYAQDYGGQSKGNSYSWISKQVVLQGLAAEDGTILLPAEYIQVLPISDKVALVMALDYRYYFVNLDPEKPRLFRLPFKHYEFYFIYGRAPETPFTLMFHDKTATDARGKTLVVMDNMGKEVHRITGVENEGSGDYDFYYYGNGKIAFPVKGEDGTGLSVVVNSLTLEMEEVGPYFETLPVGHALTDDWSRNNRSDYKQVPVQKVAAMTSGHGILSGESIYLPMRHEDGEVTPFGHPNIIGMVPLYLPEIDGVRGWLVVYEAADGRWYRLIGGAVDGDLMRGKPQELLPESVMDYILGRKNYPPFADIWIGTMDEDEYYGLFAGADRRDVPEPPLRIAARYFKDPMNRSAGVTDWYDVGMDIGPEELWAAYEARDRKATHPDNPMAMERPLILATAREWWESNKAYREYLETPWDVLQARYEAESRATLKASADAILAMSGTDVPYGGDFYTAARTLGGTYLSTYWRRWKGLPRSSDAYDICSRFGNNSSECNLVMPWAQNTFDAQRAQEQKASDAYARQVELTKRKPPAYRPPSYEPRCYDQGNGKELCFFD
ncbi:hypothetical protein [Hyphomonas sp.]|uniref:hypothetical protein n=2 Tax=Hyphomonas sp. TaxID=87 RepID=UPI0025C65B71|nr:hypothetical protein [Hyphomonas sp.]